LDIGPDDGVISLAGLRALFQVAGVVARPSDELAAKMPEFLAAIEHLADGAGGEAPLPERPRPPYLREIRARTGNEQLAKVLESADALRSDLARWNEARQRCASRWPSWERLQAILRHVAELPPAHDLCRQAEGLRAGRLLLEATDHVAPLLQHAADLARQALGEAHARFRGAHQAEMKRLEASHAWREIAAAQRKEILCSEGLAQVPAISLGTDEELLSSLDRISITSWREKADALPARFANAALRAARLLEPKTQRHRVPGQTLRNPDEVKAWIAKLEADLLRMIGEGPIVIE
jgi:hypothetical protein